MFDLLGFWFNVSIIVGILLCFIFPLGAFLVNYFVSRVTGDSYLAEKCSDKIFEWDDVDATLLGVRVPFGATVILIVLSLFGWLIVSANYVDHDVVLIETVSTCSTAMAPYTGWIALLIMVYFSIEYVARKMWNVKTKVDSILEKGDK